MKTPEHSFRLAVEYVLAREGVLSDHGTDPGGLTKYGISQRWHPEVEVSSLTVEAAIEIYRDKYWKLAACDAMPFSLALITFDAAVNQGPQDAVKYLQDSLDLTADGLAGPKTRAALAPFGVRRAGGGDARRLLVCDIASYRGLAYAAEAINSPASYAVNARGWFRRLALTVQYASVLTVSEENWL